MKTLVKTNTSSWTFEDKPSLNTEKDCTASIRLLSRLCILHSLSMTAKNASWGKREIFKKCKMNVYMYSKLNLFSNYIFSVRYWLQCCSSPVLLSHYSKHFSFRNKETKEKHVECQALSFIKCKAKKKQVVLADFLQCI